MLRDFWESVPEFGRAFIGAIVFALVGAAALSVVLRAVGVPLATAEILGVGLGLGSYLYLALRKGAAL